MKKDIDMTEFFVKALYEWFWGIESMAAHFMDIALTTHTVNNLYYKEVISKMN